MHLKNDIFVCVEIEIKSESVKYSWKQVVDTVGSKKILSFLKFLYNTCNSPYFILGQDVTKYHSRHQI